MIASFPRFSQLDIEHKSEIEKFTAKFEPYSDFNFTSLFCWNIDGTTKISKLNDNLVISLSDYLSGEKIYSILGEREIDISLTSLIELTGKLNLVPEAVIERMQDSLSFKICEDRDSFDYIYNLNELAELQGQRFKKKRNKLNRFEKKLDTSNLQVRLLRSLDSAHAQELELLCKQWSKESRRGKGNFESERKAIKKMLGSFDQLDLLIVEVTLKGSLVAFSVNEVIDNNFALCHFEKAIKAEEDNIYTFLTNQTAKILRQSGCKYANWEQDLGLDGLRKSKLSFHPERYLKKYTLQKINS